MAFVTFVSLKFVFIITIHISKIQPKDSQKNVKPKQLGSPMPYWENKYSFHQC